MTAYHLSYALLWLLAILLLPTCAVLLYVLTQLKEQFSREAAGFGNNLINRKLELLPTKDAVTGVARDFDTFPGETHIILVASPGCASCKSILAELASTTRGSLSDLRIAILCMGNFERCRAALADIQSVPTLVVDVNNDITSDLWFIGTPATIVVDREGIVADVRHPLTMKGIRAVFNEAREGDAHHQARAGEKLAAV
jgi:hypothetical protein